MWCKKPYKLQVVKKLWADMAEAQQGKQEEPFAPFGSKSRKKNKILARMRKSWLILGMLTLKWNGGNCYLSM
jgi:hypothetical protein